MSVKSEGSSVPRDAGSAGDASGSRGPASGRVLAWSPIYVFIGVFLLVFGVFNFVELPLGWKDRIPQVTRYLEATVGLGAGWVLPALWAQKLVELALGVVAALSLIRRDARLLAASIGGWMAVFTFWAFMDIWAADRVELQEHTVYFAVFALLLVLIPVLQVVHGVRAWLHAQEDSR